jgi:hypothetical protein
MQFFIAAAENDRLKSMKRNNSLAVNFLKVIGCVALACCSLSVAKAADKVDPSGTWFWVQAGRSGGPDRTNTLTIKVDGDAVKGTVGTPGRNGDVRKTEIADGKLTGDELTFKTTVERNGTTTTTTYTGKVSADSIEGTIKSQRGDNEGRSRKWKAMKQAAGS